MLRSRGNIIITYSSSNTLKTRRELLLARVRQLANVWTRVRRPVLLRAAISGKQLPEYRVPGTNLTNRISVGTTSEQGTRGIRSNYDTGWRSVINRCHRRRGLSTARNLLLSP